MAQRSSQARQVRQVRRPIPQRATNGAVHLPAPVGGINASDPASAMPPSDCLQLYNFIPYQYGLRVRSGWREWATNVGTDVPGDGLTPGIGSPMEFYLASPLGGSVVGQWTDVNPEGVRTIIAFYGKVATNNRLFACTPDGIYDVTHTGSAPVLAYQFPVRRYFSSTGQEIVPAGAGYGNYTSFANSDGNHFIAYCDGANGYLLYKESTGAWEKITKGTAVGQIDGADPDSFRFVVAWKNRLWFVPQDSSTAYYLPVSQFAGTVAPIYFGSRFRYGGELVGLWSWTVDGGTGIDDKLVAISRGGDVVIYGGTDPTFAETFGLIGVWWVGQIPPGRNVASDFGGDLFILSRLGCMPLSKLVSGGLIRDPEVFATGKIANLFNTLMTERGHIIGWSLKLHPSDNLLVVNVPPTPDKVGLQVVQSLATKGWAVHLGVPMTCMEAWQGTLYFGTADNRVCRNDGYTDGSALDGTGAKTIDCSMLTAYSSLGSARKKRVHLVRPFFSTDGTPPAYSAAARYDFDLLDLGTSYAAPTPPAGAWGTAIWGTDLWGEGSGTAHRVKGTNGMGTAVAVAVRMTTKTNTTLVGLDVIFDQGGLL